MALTELNQETYEGIKDLIDYWKDQENKSHEDVREMLDSICLSYGGRVVERCDISES